MSTATSHQLQVKGMTCQHCVKAVTRAVQQQDPQADVVVDLESGVVKVVSALPPRAISDAIREEGYEVAE